MRGEWGTVSFRVRSDSLQEICWLEILRVALNMQGILVLKAIVLLLKGSIGHLGKSGKLLYALGV